MALGRWKYSTLLPSQLPATEFNTLSHPVLQGAGRSFDFSIPGAQKPFAVIEAGVSDTQRKTNSRTEHWLRKAGGKVFHFLLKLLMVKVKLGISIKVQKSQRVLNSLTITPYWFSTDPSDALTTQSADHGRVLKLPSTVHFFQSMNC